MSFIKFLIEQQSDAFVFAFGRYSPPTKGHIEHFLKIKQYAEKENIPYKIYVSKTFDNQKNPVRLEDKVMYIKKAIPDINIDATSNMFSVVDEVSKKPNIKKLIYFAGGDYFEDEKERSLFDRLKKYANEKGLDLIAISSGERTPGISGTDLRYAVLRDNFDAFKKASPLNIGNVKEEDVKHMFNIVKMNLNKK